MSAIDVITGTTQLQNFILDNTQRDEPYNCEEISVSSHYNFIGHSTLVGRNG